MNQVVEERICLLWLNHEILLVTVNQSNKLFLLNDSLYRTICFSLPLFFSLPLVSCSVAAIGPIDENFK